MSGNHTRRAWFQSHISDGPYGPGARQGGELTVDDMSEFHEGDARVLAVCHRGGASVVLLSLEDEPEGADAHDGGDHPQSFSLGVQMGPLLHMGLQIG